MLKDEASLSREKMIKINLNSIIRNVVEDFKQDITGLNKKIEIEIINKKKEQQNFYILGIENRIEQVIANLLDNAISFSKDNQNVTVEIQKNQNSKVILRGEQKLKLTEKEINFILFLKNSNSPQNIKNILKHVWKYSSDTDTHTIETHIHRLRKKIFEKFNDNNFIKNNEKGYYI